MLQSDKSQSQQLPSDSKPAELFENCSQYTDSLIGDIDNSLPNNKKKKGLKSIDVLGNTDSDMGQKSQATHSDKNNSASQNAQQHGKYMSLNNNDQIYERDEEQEDDDGDYVHNQKLTPCHQFHEQDSPENQKIFSVQSETIKSGYASLQGRSYYKTTIDPTHT